MNITASGKGYFIENKEIVNKNKFPIKNKKENKENKESNKVINKENQDKIFIKDEKEDINIDSNKSDKKELTKEDYISFTPSSSQLQELNLNPNNNKIEFISTKSNCKILSSIYLWEENIKIVVSDIDGTITKSDLVGIMNIPFKMVDITHYNLAKYYNAIENNGYKFIYLSARSLVHSYETKHYIKSICQDGVSLPDGPIFLQPENIIKCAKLDIIAGKSDIYKKNILKTIINLFPKKIKNEVLYAGYGNTKTVINC